MKQIGILLIFMTTSSFASDQKKVAMSFMKSLKKELVIGMSKGPVNGLKHCNDKAMSVTNSYDTSKYKVGRTSLKLRNQSNKAPQVLQKLLHSYKQSNAKNPLEPRVLVLDNDRKLFVKPLYMKGMCLNCHGENLSKPIAEKLNKLYPQDKAVGYKLGDFRGLVWVEEK